MQTELYNLERGSYFCIVDDDVSRPPCDTAPTSVVVKLHKLDGMYSYCTTDDGTVIHLAAWTLVEPVQRG